ncbi:MAG TPA: oligosaccharide flippase family protein [Candidatus Saccharimonadales bacterium]|nr:oligosaccharide flippase family protein [Candidatus Saccharimonadales bacterium]
MAKLRSNIYGVLKSIVVRVWRHFMHDSLYRNSVFLLANLGVTSITGFLFVIICTHLYSQRDLGYATSLIGALGLATSLSNVGMNRTITRFLSKSNAKSQDLMTGLVLVACVSVIIGIVLTLFFKPFGIKDASSVTALVFIASAFILSIKSVFDNVFVAMRTAVGTLTENSAFNITKLITPVMMTGFGFMGIFSSQLLGALMAVLVSILILRASGFSFKARPTRSSMLGKWRFAFGSYTSDLVGGLPASILPVIVVARLGPIDGALWYAAMQIINFMLTVSSSINQAMFAEMANATNEVMSFVKKAATAMYGIMVPLTIAIILFSNLILKLFGHDYVSAASVLRLMSVFALIGVANYITGSILALYRKVFYLTFVNAANALVVLVYCLFFAHNLQGIAIGWMLGEVVNAILFVGGCIFMLKRSNQLNHLIPWR